MAFSNIPHEPALPFSPILFAGIAAQPIPQFVVQRLLDTVAAQIHHRHPDLFERLSFLDKPVFLIDPIDLPWLIVLHADPSQPRMVLAAGPETIEHAAAIRGGAGALLALLEGTRDGDALFFSRELVIEGKTEAVVALRNTLDDAEINLAEDLLPAFAPLASLLRKIVAHAQKNLAHVSATLKLVQNALTGPTHHLLEMQQRELSSLHQRIDDMEATSRRAHSKRRPS